MFCQNCGERLNDGERFCFKCGAKQAHADQYAAGEFLQSDNTVANGVAEADNIDKVRGAAEANAADSADTVAEDGKGKKPILEFTPQARKTAVESIIYTALLIAFIFFLYAILKQIM